MKSVLFLIAAAALCGCADDQRCIVGDFRCGGEEDPHALYVCNADGDWEEAFNCRDFSDIDEPDAFAYTCCAIEGVVDCHLEVSCMLVERFCNQADAWLDMYCGSDE